MNSHNYLIAKLTLGAFAYLNISIKERTIPFVLGQKMLYSVSRESKSTFYFFSTFVTMFVNFDKHCSIAIEQYLYSAIKVEMALYFFKYHYKNPSILYTLI